jgi:lantibiotic biosynthesis protein
MSGEEHVATITNWKPILTGEAAARADQSVLEIADDLREEQWAPERIFNSLAGGSAGVAIFYHELAQRWPESDYAALRDRYWNSAIDTLAEAAFARPNLYSGFTGVGWATALLTLGEHTANGGDDDAHEDLEEALLECLRSIRDPADYDLINGPTGWGLYALERWPHPRAVQALELIVDFFDERAERTPDGIRWHTAPELLPEWQRERAPKGYFNLGLSHGMPGVWVLLAQTLVRGIRPQASEKLLEGSVRWGLAQRAPGPTGLSFPTTVTEESKVPGGRLSWCYGDLGVASALYLAGQVADRPEWTQEALTLARRLTMVRQEASRNADAGLCHGSAGVGHLFNRFHQETGEEEFAHAGAYWLDVALNMRQDGIGPGRYAAWRQEPEPGWSAMPGLLEGSAGIGLAFLAATGDRDAGWDRFLSISPVPLKKPA